MAMMTMQDKHCPVCRLIQTDDNYTMIFQLLMLTIKMKYDDNDGDDKDDGVWNVEIIE